MLKFFPRVFNRRDRTNDKPSVSTEIQSAPRAFNCRVVLLDDTELTLNIKIRGKGSHLLKQVFDHLNLVEKQYFGLRHLDEFDQPHWLEPTKSISSQVADKICPTFYFGVKFYAADPCKLFEEITRYQFCLQVKRDILQGRLPVNHDLAAELAAYAVQSELGDYDPIRHRLGYVSEFRFVPNQTEEFEHKVARLHCGLKGQVPARAEYQYLDRVKWLDMYGVDLYPVQGDGGSDYFLGISPTGLIIYKNKIKISNYFWPRLVKISCKNKQFVLKVRDKNNIENSCTFECSSKQACKHIWKCCLEHHSFFRLSSATQSYQAARAFFTLGSQRRRKSDSVDEQSKLGRNSSQFSRHSNHTSRNSTQTTQHRVSGSESCPEDSSFGFRSQVCHKREVTSYNPINQSRRNGGYNSGPECCQASPWDSRHHRGLYTSKESPTSVRSELFPRRVCSGSESEVTLCSRYRRHHVNASESESQSTVRRSNCTLAAADFTESESEAGIASRRRRHRDRSSETLTYCAEPSCCRASGCHSNVYPSSSRSAFSVVSAPGCSQHRTRSRSANRRPPEELAQHFRYVDPAETGLTQEQLRDIPYTHVETDSVTLRMKYSPRTRHRLRQRRQKSCGETSVWLPDGEAPPPYLGPPMPAMCQQDALESRLSVPNCIQRNLRRNIPNDYLKSPMPVQITETQLAPIVKTRTALSRVESLPSRSNHRRISSSRIENYMPESRHNRMSSQIDTVQQQPQPQLPSDQTCSTRTDQWETPQSVLSKHVREDSGLEMDSPESSQTTGVSPALPNLQQSPRPMHRMNPESKRLPRLNYTEQESFNANVQQPLRQAANAFYCTTSRCHDNGTVVKRQCVPTVTYRRRVHHTSGFSSDIVSAIPTNSHRMTDL